MLTDILRIATWIGFSVRNIAKQAVRVTLLWLVGLGVPKNG